MLLEPAQPVINLTSFLFNDPAHTQIYTLSLHDALPILIFLQKEHQPVGQLYPLRLLRMKWPQGRNWNLLPGDRKSTRLNSSHTVTSYAVFCLKKKIFRWSLR